MSKIHTVHLKHCRLVEAPSEIHIPFKGFHYTLTFASDLFDPGKGVLVTCTERRELNTDLLLWLSVYFGEDFVDPYQQMDTRHSGNRGDFKVNQKGLLRFMSVAEKRPPKSYPQWKRRLLESAIIYYSVAVRSGINMMPLTIGFFGMSLECIGNLRHGNKDDYQSLGNKRFLELVATRFARYKRSTRHRDSIKKFHRYIRKDIDLIHTVRNAYYGHSFLHLQKDRAALTAALREWFERGGCPKKQAAHFFRQDRLELDMAVVSDQLYKVGLRTSRLLLFMLLGITKGIPFGSHDYLPRSDRRDGEPMHFHGITMTVTSSTSSATVSQQLTAAQTGSSGL